MTNYTFYPEATRGQTNIGWLNARHSFNFAGFHHPQRNPFGALVILNEDTIAPGKGFGTHGHSNMEIVSIILEGKVRHLDSMGNLGYIDQGEAQIISAGTGITHSEFNHNNNLPLKLLQIWIKPEQNRITPEYGQMSFDGKEGLIQIISPNGGDGTLRIHQQAWISLALLQGGDVTGYKIKKAGDGVYVYVISGQLTILGKKLSAGDAIGITNADSFTISQENDALAVIIEAPMN